MVWRIIIAVLVNALVSTELVAAKGCPGLSTAVGHLCISHVSITKSNFTDAQETCKNQNSALILPLTQLQCEDVTNFMSKRHSQNGTSKWLGPLLGSRRFNGTDIFLNSFNNSVVTYMNWKPGEPNNYNEAEDCTAIYYPSSAVQSIFTAIDASCHKTSSIRIAICQMAAECHVPVISYGVATVNSTSREVGVSCVKNYVVGGSFPSYCGVKGLTPSDFNVACEFLKCKDVQISNGKPLYSKAALQMPGTNRKFVCDAGYQLNETNEAVCVTDSDSKARWNQNTPVCQKNCGTTFVEHGTIQYSDGAGHHGSQMTIECEPGYFSSMTTTHCIDGIWEHVLGCIGNSNQRCPIHIASADTLYVGSSCYWVTENSESWENSFEQCIADGGKLAPGTGSDLWQDQLFPFINQQNIQIWINARQVANLNYEYESTSTQKRLSLYMPKISSTTNLSNECFFAIPGGTVELELCSVTHRALCVKDQPWAKYRTKKNMRMSAAVVLHSTMATSQIHCGMQCTRTTDCLGVNYYPMAGVCEILDRKYLDNEDLLEVAIGWEVGYKIY